MRKRKARVVWLPVDIENRVGKSPQPADNAAVDSSHFIKIFTLNPLGDPALTEEIPVVLDQQNASLGGTANILTDKTLADVAQSGYRLRRIVGKVWFGIQQDAQPDPQSPTTGIITAGFIIRHTAANGASMAAVAGGPTGNTISTSTLDNIDDPWIWRRSWLLSNVASANPDANTFPVSSNLVLGSALDGPHVDAKTARIVGPEERLFLSVTCTAIDGTSQGPPVAVICVGDLRVLASMRSSVGNRRNAVR